MTFRDLVQANRSYRRFDGNHPLSVQTLRGLVDLARVAASGANRQPLRYVVSADPATNAKIYDTLAWAGYLTDWDGPEPKERPTGYIVVLLDTNVNKAPGADHGIACQTMLLGAVEQGLGGCMFGSIRRDQLREMLGIDIQYEIALVVALGKPVEQVVLETATSPEEIKYYRDDKQVHHVPKLPLSSVILAEFGS
jgi:nitroreductase